VSGGKFLRVMILPHREKITLVERRKEVERDPTCCENSPLQAPQQRRRRSLVGGELRETNTCLSKYICGLPL
jgi:hypothetical protein